VLTDIPICPNRLPAWQRARREGGGKGVSVKKKKSNKTKAKWLALTEGV